MKILVLSAYHADSHRRWLRGLIDHLGHHEFEVFTQPPRHFPWRSRGNSLTWAFDDELRAATADLILATSMVDLAGLRGMMPHLAQIPTVVYFHENQFAYPTQDDRENANLLVTNLYTALAADRVLFNSPYNRRSFLEKAAQFLQRMPDQVPDGVIATIEAKSEVLPVPLEDALLDEARPTAQTGPLRLVWNHRWEFDKAPERFFNALFSLQEDLDFRLVVMGQQFRQAPAIFEQARRRLRDHIDHWGWVDDRDDYLRWLQRSDLVVSTAIHEFQGLAIQEAALLGCLPVVPDRLAYPDFFPSSHRYPSHLNSPAKDAASLATHLRPLLRDPSATREHESLDLDGLFWSKLSDQYESVLRSTRASATAR